MADEELERRLDDLRNRVNRERSKIAERRVLALRRMCYLVAAIVFVATLFILDVTNHPKEASILGLLYAAIAFCIAILIALVIRRLSKPPE